MFQPQPCCTTLVHSCALSAESLSANWSTPSSRCLCWHDPSCRTPLPPRLRKMLSAHSTCPSTKLQQPQHRRPAALLVSRPASNSNSRACQHSRVAAAAPAAPPADAPAADATSTIVQEEAQYVLQTYGRPADVVFVRGEGSKLYDMNNREYLDMAAGGCLGCCNDVSTRFLRVTPACSRSRPFPATPSTSTWRRV